MKHFHLNFSSSNSRSNNENESSNIHDGTQQIITLTSDWTTAEFTLLNNAAKQPCTSLSPLDVAITCSRALQFVDHPNASSGLKTCFDFFTWECRKTVTARKGGDTIHNFCTYGLLSPALQPFMGASSITIGEGTITPASPPLRGSIASFPIVIKTADVLSVRHMSGMDKNGVSNPPERQMVIRLEQQRRPPMQGCWLVREVLDVRHAFAGDLGNPSIAG